MRAAIYARYSSEQQDRRSIDDQLRLCRAHAAKLGADVVDIYTDAAISGTHLGTRPEALRLLEDAKARRFDTVIAEALDRLSRDQEDVAGIFKRLRFAGVAIVTVAEGIVDELHIGLKGTMNALFVRDLAAKVRRGQVGRVAAGLAAGGRSYGYRVVRTLDDTGELVRGRRVIDEAEANVVRRIFRDYVGGMSGRAIAKALNAEGVPAPFGRQWNASTIRGHRQRGNGILYNRLYAGELVYNRVTMVKDPETGRRLSRPNPRAQWTIVAVPGLRIVPEDLWTIAQEMKAAEAFRPPERQMRPKHLFSGLMACSACGGAYVAIGKDHVGCSRHKESGTCANGGGTRRSEIERRVLAAVQRKLLAPEALRAALKAYHEERARLRSQARSRQGELEGRLPKLAREIERLVDAICDGTATSASNARLVALEAEKTDAVAELARLAADHRIIALHPGAIEAYTRDVAELQATLASGAIHRPEAIRRLRRLVDHIEIRPMGRGRAPEILLHGRLSELMNLPERQPGTPPSSRAVVAGEGLEPPTLGL
jgi:site-specific DNA recombinase